MGIFILATLDTKGQEAAFVRDRFAALDLTARLVDTGCLGTPSVRADVTREAVYAKGQGSLAELRARGDRGAAIQVAAAGARELVVEAERSGELSGVLAIGGSAGTTIGTEAMRALKLGVPKVMVSTLASGQVRHYVGDTDILMLNSVVDISGLNRISRPILAAAAHAMAGMVRFRLPSETAGERPLIAATMFGVTTRCVERARVLLEAAGYE